MVDHVALRRESLMRMLAVVRGLGVGDDLDTILDRITRAVVDVLGFQAVVVNVKVAGDGLVVKTAIGPPEVCDMVGETMSHDTWISLLSACERWGELRFHEDLSSVDIDGDVYFRDPDPEHYVLDRLTDLDRPWRASYALLAPMWAGEEELLGVLSVDLPVSGRVPDPEQCEMLELFAGQAGAAIAESVRIDKAEDEQLQYRVVFLESPIATAMLGLDSTIDEVNEAFEGLVGRSNSELKGMELAALFGAEGRYSDVEDRLVLRPDDEQRWVHVNLRRIDGASGTRFVYTAEDRSDAHLALESLRARAERDDLTGLGVRSLALKELEERLKLDDDGLLAFLYCDLDGFKAINDDHGHLVGDRLLVDIAGGILRCAGVKDRVCRLGGDEFAIVASRESIAEVEELARKCVTAAAGPVADLAAVGMSVGVCVVRVGAGGRHTAESIVEAADSMLYRAKGDGGRGWRTVVLD